MQEEGLIEKILKFAEILELAKKQKGGCSLSLCDIFGFLMDECGGIRYYGRKE